jgi:nitroreductase
VMNVTEALLARHTVRAFRSDPVPRETVAAILGAALHAPSWANTQPWEVYVAAGATLERLRLAFVERTHQGIPGNPDLPVPEKWPEACRERTRELSASQAKITGRATDDVTFRRDFLESNRRFFQAPVVVYLCLDRSLTPWSIFDSGMMAQSVMLAAQDQGVDSAIAVNLVVYPDLIRTELGIPEALLVLIGIALGYRDPADPEGEFRSARRTLEEAVRLYDP